MSTVAPSSPADARLAVNWRQVGLFLGLTFGLTWLLDLALYLAGGLMHPAAGVLLQTQMLMPALSAIVLGLFAWHESPLYFRGHRTGARWFCYCYLLTTAIFLGLTAAAVLSPAQARALSAVGLAPAVAGLLVVAALRLARGRDSFAGSGMAGGSPRYWLLFGLGFVAFYTLQTLLNCVFGLGQPVDLAALAYKMGTNLPPAAFLASAFVNAVLLGPFLGLLLAFGEEYGWRGYLQGELVKLGRARGILLLGTIWGLWHAPVILMGYNYPGYPLPGVVLMTLYTVLLGFVLGYVVLKTGGIWLAAFLHALNNQAYSFLAGLVYAPRDPVFSFGLGLFGLATLAVVVLIILRDPLWRIQGEAKAEA